MPSPKCHWRDQLTFQSRLNVFFKGMHGNETKVTFQVADCERQVMLVRERTAMGRYALFGPTSCNIIHARQHAEIGRNACERSLKLRCWEAAGTVLDRRQQETKLVDVDTCANAPTKISDAPESPTQERQEHAATHVPC